MECAKKHCMQAYANESDSDDVYENIFNDGNVGSCISSGFKHEYEEVDGA